MEGYELCFLICIFTPHSEILLLLHKLHIAVMINFDSTFFVSHRHFFSSSATAQTPLPSIFPGKFTSDSTTLVSRPLCFPARSPSIAC